MPRQSEDTFEKCTAKNDIASCTNFFFGQVSVIDWIGYNIVKASTWDVKVKEMEVHICSISTA